MTNKISFFTWEGSEDGINGNDELWKKVEEDDDDDEERKESNDEQEEGYGPEHIGEQREVRGPEQSEAIVNGPSHKKKIESLQVFGSSSGGKRNKQKLVSMKDYGCDGMRSIIEEDGEDSEELIAMFVSEEDPEKFEEAIKHDKRRKAMEAEIKSIEENNTWELVELPLGANVIGVKWVFKTKFNERGESYKFKARLVAKQFLPVPRWDTIRVILALAAQKNWKIFQLNVKSVFLHGDLSEDVYVEQPKGFESSKESEKVYKLKKILYGLRHSSRAKIEGYFEREGFKNYCEHSLFVKTEGENRLIISLYVDDHIYTSNCDVMIEEFKASMKEEFSVTDLDSSPVKLSKNPVLHRRSKHINVRYHFLRELVNEGVIEMEHCSTHDQLSDVMTKPVKLEVFESLKQKLGVTSKEE